MLESTSLKPTVFYLVRQLTNKIEIYEIYQSYDLWIEVSKNSNEKLELLMHQLKIKVGWMD